MSLFPKSILLLLGLTAALSRPVAACDACALYLTPDDTPPGVTTALAYQFTRLGTIRDGAERLGNPGDQFLNSSTTQLTVAYRSPGPWQVQATVPWLRRTFRRAGHFVYQEGRVSGVGDATLAGRLALWQPAVDLGAFSFALLGGVKFGTGKTDYLLEEVNHPAHHHAGFPDDAVHSHDLTLGSGSTDYLLGAEFAWRRDAWTARASVQHKLRRPGDFAYRFADETSGDLAAGRAFTVPNGRVTVQALFSAEHKGSDTLAGAEQDDTSFSASYAGARVAFTRGQRFFADLSLELPVRIRTPDLTVTPDYRLRASVSWRL